MLETTMMFKLMCRNWRWLWHLYACCVSQGIIIINILFKREWRFCYHFVPK